VALNCSLFRSAGDAACDIAPAVRHGALAGGHHALATALICSGNPAAGIAAPKAAVRNDTPICMIAVDWFVIGRGLPVGVPLSCL
jgi:hypothetical protein